MVFELRRWKVAVNLLGTSGLFVWFSPIFGRPDSDGGAGIFSLLGRLLTTPGVYQVMVAMLFLAVVLILRMFVIAQIVVSPTGVRTWAANGEHPDLPWSDIDRIGLPHLHDWSLGGRFLRVYRTNPKRSIWTLWLYKQRRTLIYLWHLEDPIGFVTEIVHRAPEGVVLGPTVLDYVGESSQHEHSDDGSASGCGFCRDERNHGCGSIQRLATARNGNTLAVCPFCGTHYVDTYDWPDPVRPLTDAEAAAWLAEHTD